MFNWDLEKDNLENYINTQKLSYEEIGRLYNCSGNNIKKVTKRLGITLTPRRIINSSEHFNKQDHLCLYCGKLLNTNRKYCNKQCESQYEYEKYINDWKSHIESGYGPRYKISKYLRRYILEKNNYSCELCGCNLKNPYTGLSILQIHHIDGDAANTEESNLQLLCPNCHAMTENFGSRNKSSIREYRIKDYNEQEALMARQLR